MKKRLHLIWAALFWSMAEVEAKTYDVMVANNRAYADSVRHHLDKIKHETWDLEGVRIAHSNKDLDVSEIQRFLGNAPYIIKNLLAIIQDGKIP